MSRIGRKAINLPAGVTVNVGAANAVNVKGPKGELNFGFNEDMKIDVKENEVEVSRPSDSKKHKTFHGTTRALLNSMIIGVSEGFTKKLKIIGVGYRAQMKGKQLVVAAGYSHPVEVNVPEGISIELPSNTEITITGIDKQKVGQFAADIRAIRPPEPYKGKGIRYVDEYVRSKEGKTAK